MPLLLNFKWLPIVKNKKQKHIAIVKNLVNNYYMNTLIIG